MINKVVWVVNNLFNVISVAVLLKVCTHQADPALHPLQTPDPLVPRPVPQDTASTLVR